MEATAMNYPTIEQAKRAANENSIIRDFLNKGWRKAGFYVYQNENCDFLYCKIRLDPPLNSNEDKQIRPLHFDGEKWILKEPKFNGKKPLYLLPSLIQNPNATIYIVEGEKCADALAKLGLIATTSGSAGSAKGADWTPLKGRKIIIWRDNDDAGLKYAMDVTEQLQEVE